jgi:tyrosine-protein phosphatase SIW14
MERRELLVPPLNFAMVMPGIYRSGFFNRRNHQFLKKSLKIRGVMYVSCDSYTEHKIGEDNLAFMKESGIQMFTCRLNSHKGAFASTEERVVAEALSIILDVRNHPILLHDDKGKHRAGVLIGCLRKLQGWSLASIFNEYALFTMGSVRFPDMQWIELFSHPITISVEHVPRWLKVDSDFQALAGS